MASFSASNVDKPVDSIHSNNLPDASKDHLASALTAVVDNSSTHSDVSQNTHASMRFISNVKWVHKLIPGIESLSNRYHVGNFVAMRGTDEQFFESMPIYARIGMHLLFYGREQVKLLETHTLEELLREQSIKQGKIYDSPESVASIPSFVQTYSIQVDELLNPNFASYKCFNEFFYRKLREGARPVQNIEDPTSFCSAADCRLTVYQSVNLAKHFWIKGRNFDIPTLLNVEPDSPTALQFDGASLAIFRLAPADYHRFHSPLDGIVGDSERIPGQYFTVNPEAVNEENFDVFTANTRSVLYLTHAHTKTPVAFVAIGALLVGSIQWTVEKGHVVGRGDELGYFAYGGSTIVAIFPSGLIQFDEDLVTNSKKPIETLMKAGYSLGRIASPITGANE